MKKINERRRIENLIKQLKATYKQVGVPQHDIMKVVNRGKYGFFNMEGKLIIPFMYDWSSSFARVKLYGKTYIGAYVINGDYKTIVNVENQSIIVPMKKDTRYYIINDKLWVKDEKGYNLINRKGKKLLSNDYDLIMNDRFRQPKNVYLVEKNGKFGAIYISRNNKENGVLPLAFQYLSFWYAPSLGVFIKASINGTDYGLYKLDGRMAIPCKYKDFEYQTPFRKGFILVNDEQNYTLYDGDKFIALVSSDYYIGSQYAFLLDDISYYSIHTNTQELLVSKEGRIVANTYKEQYISFFHYLMNLQKESFKFKSLRELLRYCRKIKKGEMKLTSSVQRELVMYGYYYLEEELHKYAKMHQFEYVQFTLHDTLPDKYRSWGTCHTYERKISLNLNLIFTSEKYIKLVILHELVHLKNASHNKYFFRTLNELYGSDTRKVRMNPVNILDAVDSVSIIKKQKRDLFAKAKQRGMECPPDVSSTCKSNMIVDSYLSEGLEVAAMEK